MLKLPELVPPMPTTSPIGRRRSRRCLLMPTLPAPERNAGVAGAGANKPVLAVPDVEPVLPAPEFRSRSRLPSPVSPMPTLLLPVLNKPMLLPVLAMPC